MAKFPGPLSRAWTVLTTPSTVVSVAVYLGCAALFAIAFYPIHYGYEFGWLAVLASIWIAGFRALVVRRDRS